MTKLEFTRIIPRLPVADLRRSLAFYRDELGFQVDVLWPNDAPTFTIVNRDAIAVGLFELTPERPGTIGYAELYVQVSDAVALHRQLSGKLTIEWGPEVYSYGRREFAIRDPDDYLIIFTEPTDDPPTTDEP